MRLGCTTFGGPIAHLGYFRREFVERLGWIDEGSYADLVALCQFLPGPASSQVAIAIGLHRARWRGGLAAWLGFTLPSTIALIVFASAAPHLPPAVQEGLIHGLKLVAVAIIGHAVVGMARTLCPDRARAMIAVAAIIILTVSSSGLGPIAAIGLGAGLGLLFCDKSIAGQAAHAAEIISARLSWASLAAFLLLLFGLPLAAASWSSATLTFLAAIYRAGALVFGGGHVLLPLLRDAVVVPGWIHEDAFLAGYGAAQAVPGPLFTFAAYLGDLSSVGPGGVRGALLAIGAIFLPGVLILLAALPHWQALKTKPAARAAISGTNAAVVGILAFALYNPLWISSVKSPADFAAATTGFILLVAWKSPPLLVVGLGIAFGVTCIYMPVS
jgi:chromate transporter